VEAMEEQVGPRERKPDDLLVRSEHAKKRGTFPANTLRACRPGLLHTAGYKSATNRWMPRA